jgi:hypothetical protein
MLPLLCLKVGRTRQQLLLLMRQHMPCWLA